MTPNAHSQQRDKADWLTAFLCFLGGLALTAVVWDISLSLGSAGLGRTSLEVFTGAIASLTFVIARRLRRRARGLFVAGVLTPIVCGLLFFAWLILAFASGDWTF